MAIDLRAALREHFGFESFRGSQEAVVRQVVGGGDALVIMATGEGKSLCYQVPALVLDGLTLVVSPLIALMEDQTRALREKGLPATCIHSALTAEQRRARLKAVLAGEVKLLYVTPERFRVGTFSDDVKRLRIALLAIDEAHCVSQWGHDFRPDYGRLGEVREALGRPPTLALTATATPAVQADIRRVLGLEDAPLFHTGIERPNLFLSVQQVVHHEDKLPRVLEVVARIGGPGIVYFALIRELLRCEDLLRRNGYRPLVYHGDLSPSERREQQSAFVASDDALILATNAFGMGVDKPNIRFILHHQVPRTLEAYYQEVGRAGRDGKGSLCELLYFEEDVAIQREFTEWANPDFAFALGLVQHMASLGERLHGVDAQDLRETFLVKNRRDGRIETVLNLLETAGCVRGELGRDFEWLRTPTADEIHAWLPDDKRERDLMGLLQMVRYARDEDCRKRAIERYFGFEPPPGPCGACDLDTALEGWLDAHLPESARRPVPRQAPGAAATAAAADTVTASATATADRSEPVPLARGDWIDVRRLGLCHVTRVHREGHRTRIDVEVARDLTTRSLDLKKWRWRKVE